MSTIEPASAARRASIARTRAAASAAGCTACDATLAAEARARATGRPASPPRSRGARSAR
jgi:hypothetical protein